MLPDRSRVVAEDVDDREELVPTASGHLVRQLESLFGRVTTCPLQTAPSSLLRSSRLAKSLHRFTIYPQQLLFHILGQGPALGKPIKHPNSEFNADLEGLLGLRA